MENRSDLEAKIDDVDYVRFTYSDIHGIARGKTVPARHAKTLMKEGVGAYAGKFYLYTYFNSSNITARYNFFSK